MSSITLASPAKLNLILDLLRKREDGYHEVEFVMQELEIHDTITIETIPNVNTIVLSCTDPSVPLDEKNTCWKAVQLMQEELKKQNKSIQGAKIHIDKKIPSAGGLGGGSSNAASVLKGLNELWQLNLSKNALKELAAQIGSDVPFFIEGGTCFARGRGEIVSPIEKCPILDLAFIVPPINVPEQKTKWIYGAFDVKKVEKHPSITQMQKAIQNKSVQECAQAMGNVFEYLDLPEYHSVFHLIEQLNQLPGIKISMLAGAGPTVVAVCDSEKVSSQIIEPFRAKGWVAFATRTV